MSSSSCISISNADICRWCGQMFFEQTHFPFFCVLYTVNIYIVQSVVVFREVDIRLPSALLIYTAIHTATRCSAIVCLIFYHIIYYMNIITITPPFLMVNLILFSFSIRPSLRSAVPIVVLLFNQKTFSIVDNVIFRKKYISNFLENVVP